MARWNDEYWLSLSVHCDEGSDDGPIVKPGACSIIRSCVEYVRY